METTVEKSQEMEEEIITMYQINTILVIKNQGLNQDLILQKSSQQRREVPLVQDLLPLLKNFVILKKIEVFQDQILRQKNFN